MGKGKNDDWVAFFSFDPKSKGDFDEGYIGAVDVNFYEPNY